MSIGLVSFSTPKYRDIYETHLKPTEKYWFGESLHLDYDGSRNWARNTQLKPKAILEALERWDSCLYLDSDSRISDSRVNGIASIASDNPIACMFLDHEAWYGNDSRIMEPLTGTIYFTREAVSFIEEWIAALINTQKTDGEVFRDLLISSRISAKQLGIEWAYITSLPRGGIGGLPCSDPIITHHQASRRFKNVA
jgi:hypothetical protein